MFFIGKNLKKIIKKRFENIHFDKIILYRNPNEFNAIKIERVNPNHVGILWGKRKKKLNKGTNYIMFGKVYFKALPVIVGLSVCGWLDCITNYTFKILFNLGVIGCIFGICVSILLFYVPTYIVKGVKC